MSLEFDVFVVDPKPIPSAVPGFEQALARPGDLADSIVAMEEQISPGYLQVWGGFFPGQLTSRPVAPAPLAGTTLPIGAATATIIPVGTTDTGHSSVVHVPALSRVVSGDVGYNQTHMWVAAYDQLSPDR